MVMTSLGKNTTVVDVNEVHVHSNLKVPTYYLATSMTDGGQIVTGLLFYAYVEMQQVRKLVFDNYQ